MIEHTHSPSPGIFPDPEDSSVLYIGSPADVRTILVPEQYLEHTSWGGKHAPVLGWGWVECPRCGCESAAAYQLPDRVVAIQCPLEGAFFGMGDLETEADGI